MSAFYNEYVLDTALNQGWITPAQKESAAFLLGAYPEMGALDLLEEQQILSSLQVAAFRDAIAKAEQESATREGTTQ